MEKKEHVWQRWKREYVHSLMEMHRIKRGDSNYPDIGEVVLIVGNEKNRGEWKKGRVLRHIRGRDGVVRGVMLLHKGHHIERPLSLVCSLEIKGAAVAGKRPTAEVQELRWSNRRAAQDAIERVQLMLQEEDE